MSSLIRNNDFHMEFGIIKFLPNTQSERISWL